MSILHASNSNSLSNSTIACLNFYLNPTGVWNPSYSLGCSSVIKSIKVLSSSFTSYHLSSKELWEKTKSLFYSLNPRFEFVKTESSSYQIKVLEPTDPVATLCPQRLCKLENVNSISASLDPKLKLLLPHLFMSNYLGNLGSDVVVFILNHFTDKELSELKIYDEIPLNLAASKGHTQIVKYLIARNVLLNEKDLLGLTPLMRAAKNGHLNIVLAFLNKGLDPNVSAENGVTALSLAKENGHQEITTVLLSKGASDFVTETGSLPVGKQEPDACIQPKNEVENLSGADLTTSSSSSDINKQQPLSQLRVAVDKGDVELIKTLLLTEEAEINTPDNEGITPFMAAILKNNITIVQLFLKEAKKESTWSEFFNVFSVKDYNSKIDFFLVDHKNRAVIDMVDKSNIELQSLIKDVYNQAWWNYWKRVANIIAL